MTPDITFDIHNTAIATYLTESAVYSPNDYDVTKVPTSLSGTPYDTPNATTIDLPTGSSKFILYDTVAKTEQVISVSGSTYTITNLIPNRVYAYTVRNSSGTMLSYGTVKATGHIRMIDGGGNTFNIRDLGGWTCDGGKTKYGLIYRGAELNGAVSLNSSQVDFFKNVLGIRDEIDLRNPTSTGVGSGALGLGVDYVNIYTNYSPYALQDLYRQERVDIIKRIAKNIKEKKVTYIHCSAGADRTAIICTFIEAICGVSQNDIDRDYELSAFAYDTNNDRLSTRTRNNTWLNGHRTMINGDGTETYSYPYINNMEGSSFQDKIVRFLLRSGVTIDELNDIRFGLIDGNPTALTNPYGNATITKNLSHVFIGNEDTSVKLYQPFEARVLPNDGYILTSVSVAMGGTDITSTAYNAERILIPKVTGDIIITASATDVVIPDDNDKYPSVTAVRDYVNTKTDDLQDYIENDLDELDEAKVSKPSTSPNGTNGQLLRTKGDGTTEWVDVIDNTLSAQGAAAEAKTTGEARNRFDSTVQGASSTNTSDSIYLKTGETAKITISNFDGTLISVFIKGHNSQSLPIYRDGVYKFTAQYDGLLRLYGAGTTTFIADVELMTLAAVRLENTQAQADRNTLEIDTLKDTVFSSVNGDVEQGSYHTAGGWKYNTDIACRTASYTPQTALRAVFNDGIKASVRAFDINGTYVGGYTGSGFSTDYTQFVKLDSPIALRDFTAEYGYNWKLVFTKSAGGNIVPNDVGLQYEVSAIPDEAEIYTVGTNGDFSGFTEMLIALASNSKEKIVYVDGGVYDIFDEMGGAEYISSIENASSLSWRGVNHIVPPNTTIIGVGKVVLEWNPSDSEIIDQNHAFLFSPLNLSGSCTIKNIEIRCSNCRYGIHDETGGTAVYDGTERVLDNVRVYFTASTYGVHYAYGAGHNKNSKYIYNNCVFSAAYGIAWSSHDWPATEYENSTFEFNNCIFKNNLPTSPSGKAGIRFSSSATDSRQDIVKINGCDFNSITFGTEGSSSVKQGYTVTTMLCPSFTVTYTDRIASGDRIAPTVYLSVSGGHGSDKQLNIERGGELYSEADDFVYQNRKYAETDIPIDIDPQPETETDLTVTDTPKMLKDLGVDTDD